jgi:hypothetical protein
MKSRFRSLCVVSAVLSLASCDKPTPPAATAPATTETDNQLAEARDALQRQALEIETKTALMDKQLAEMEQSLKDRDNAELRGSLDTLKRQNEALRVQADAARQQSNAITQRITVTPPPNLAPQPMALPDYSLFYQQLAPFGRWFEVNGYGYCWRPTITVAGWRPYVDGCWVWTSLGWAWQSNEPFGWATYHYGRWVNLARYGWVWVPGSEWAPAWVAWRQSRDCVGWAPLPPEQGVCNGVYRDCDSRYGLGPASYTFINTNQFVSRSYINVYAPVIRQTTIYQHSVNVTQIVPGRGQGHAFVHQGGPPRAQMEQACGQPVPQRQVQTMHAEQLPEHQQHHAGRDALAPVAMVELPAVTPGARVMHPEVKEHIQRPIQISGFEGVPQQAVTEIRETIAREKETASVQQQPVHGHMPRQAARHPVEAPAVVIGAPSVPNAPPHETVRPASPAEKPVLAGESVTPAATIAVQPQPRHERMPHESPRHSAEVPAVSSVTPMRNAPTQETVRPVVAAEPSTGVAREHKHHGDPVVIPAPASLPLDNKTVEGGATAAASATQPPPAVVTAPPAVMSQPPAEPSVSQQPATAEKMAAEQGAAAASAESERARMQAAREQSHAAAMEQRQQQALQERAMGEKRATEQATANAEAEKSRMQAAAAQQEALTAQQQRTAADQAAAETEKARQQAATAAAQQQQEMAAQQQRMAADQAAAETEKARQQAATAAAQQQQEMAAQQQRTAADQAAAETEKARQQAATAAAQQQQEMAAQQQRAAAERMASDQAAAAEADRVRQQTEAAAMQRQQEEATRRAAEEQQMRAQKETERRTQEMAAQRQAEEQVRRQQEAETQRAQEQARRAAEEQQMRAQQEAAQRAQEMAQRQAEEQVRRQQESEMQRAQEQARRAAEEQQMRAQQEAAQRAQEMAQRQAEEQTRRAQEQAQRQAEEQARRAQEEAQRAAAEAARNQPRPAPGS